MADKGKKSEGDPYTGKGYSSEEWPDSPGIPKQYGTITTQCYVDPPKERAPQAPRGSAGERTDFETARLNDMVDLVQSSIPSDLIDVGDALWEAGRAIKKAEEELKTYFEEVDWDGDGKGSFARWGRKLRADTEKLSTYAGTVGAELNAAGCGLLMVQTYMPKRSEVLTVNDIPAPARVPGNPQMPAPLLTGSGKAPSLDGNGKLTGSGDTPLLNNGGGTTPSTFAPRAVHPDSPEGIAAERDRQEAIQHLNKLGSYYAISLDNIRKAEADKPTFSGLPGGDIRPGAPDGGGGPSATTSGGSPVGQGGTPSAITGGSPGGDGGVTPAGRVGPQEVSGGVAGGGRPDVTDLPPTGTVQDPLNRLDPSEIGASAPASRVGTDIDSVNVPPTSTIDPVTPSSPPPTANPSMPGPTPNGPGPVVPSGPPISQPGPLGRGPIAPMPVTPPTTSQGRTVGPPGRSVPTGPGLAGGGGGTGPTNRPPMMGMPYAPMGPGAGQGTTGGRGPGGATRASQPGGIVGGTPSGTPGGQNGTSARGPMGMMPMGAMGAGAAGMGAGGTRGASGRRIASAPGGIVGTPRSGTPGQGRGSRQFTPGGSGLVSGAQPRERDRREGPPRPDYLTEDEETWTNGRRGSVPPVIE
ncbi:hypothetical protein GCM10009801_78760 [Streptomyces albiaxialis]|uniref:Uncharacterized protein n=2 Tax=Streptomyces albiaxialis TaxID=329523 RepID=A0ABP5ISY0_9ACTN